MIERDPITQTILCGVNIQFGYSAGEIRPASVDVSIDGIMLDTTAEQNCGPVTDRVNWMDLSAGQKTILKQIFTWAKQKLDDQIGEIGTLPPMPGE